MKQLTLLLLKDHLACCCVLVLIMTTSCSPTKHSSSSRSLAGDNQKNASASSKSVQERYAKTLGVSPQQVSNIQLYRFLDEWMNAPYKYAGKSKAGVDCSGFTEILLKEVYGKNFSGSSADLFNVCMTVDVKKLREGDLLFFKIKSKEISHVGVYLMNNKFVHASTQAGVIISDLNEPYYEKYFFKGGRLKEN